VGFLLTVARAIDSLNEVIGRAVSWLALALVLIQFTVVILRYVFGIGSIFLQESLLYFHGALFMLAAGYTLLHDGHVRVDIFYRDASLRYRALVDLGGSLVLLLPVCGLIWTLSFDYVAMSWAIDEGSPETSGIPAVYLLKSAILAFAILVGLQGISLAIHAARRLAGYDDGGDRAPTTV